MVTEIGQAKLSLYNLRCVTRAGAGPIEDRQHTMLGYFFKESRPFVLMKNGGHKMTKLLHRGATTNGCKMDILDGVANFAHIQFGFADVDVKVIKTTKKARLNHLGQCKALYREELRLTLDPEVTLVSNESEHIDSDDCQ